MLENGSSCDNGIEKKVPIRLFNRSKHITIDERFRKEHGRLIELNNGWKVITYGKVEQYSINMMVQSIDLAFNKLNYRGEQPEIHISSGALLLLSGEEALALFNTTKNGIKRIKVSEEAVWNTANSLGLDKGVVFALCGAHEATHIDQSYRKGVNMQEIVADDKKSRQKLTFHPLELEADMVAHEVARDLFGINALIPNKR